VSESLVCSESHLWWHWQFCSHVICESGSSSSSFQQPWIAARLYMCYWHDGQNDKYVLFYLL